MVEMGPASKPTVAYSPKRLIPVVLLGWLVAIGFDFFQHAGLFAKLWLESAPAFLPPEALFQRIPLGYLAFLLSTILVTWLMVRLNLSGWKQGAAFGLTFGAVSEGALVLGTLSAFPVSPSLLIAWFFGGVVQYCIVCSVIGSGLGGTHLGRLLAKVLVFVAVLVVVTIILQTLGYAPAIVQAK